MKTTLALAALALAVTSGAVAAQDLDLLLAHKIRISGKDGMTVTSEFSERFVRRDGQVWFERVVPVALQTPHVHAGGGTHFNIAGAARWVSADGKKAAKLALVDRQEQLVIDVDRADYGNVGFTSSWDQAYYLIDPRTLVGMHRKGALTDGARWYESRRPDGVVQVLWDEGLNYPRQVLTVSSNGLNQKSLLASRTGAAKELPWQRTRDYDRKGYNDLMD